MSAAHTCPSCGKGSEQETKRHNAHHAAQRVGIAYHGSSDFVVKEFLLNLPDWWMRNVCRALCRRHELIAWRENGMRHHKVWVAAPELFMAEVFEPAMNNALTDLTKEINKLAAHYISANVAEPAAEPVNPDNPAVPFDVEEWG